MRKLLLFTAVLYISQLLYAQTPVAYYPFNGNANDAVGINNGIVTNATLTADRFGNTNSAYNFDGLDDRINAPLSTTVVDNFSIEGWAKISTLTSDNQIIFHNGNSFLNGWGLLISSTGSLVILYGAVSYTTVPFQCSLNQWYHFALVRTNGITKAYANGTEVFNSNIASPVAPTDNFCIGNMSTGTNFFNGVVDNVKVYNTALTAQEVSDLYNNIEFCNGIDDDGDGLIDETCIPNASMGDATINEGNAGTQEMRFTLSLDHPYTDVVQVKYTTADSTASRNTDYVKKQGIINFQPGQVTKRITVTINGDSTVEANEFLKVLASQATNAKMLDSIGVGRIRNDDVAAAVMASGSDEAKVITVKLSPNPAKDMISLSGLKPVNTTIQIADMQGRIVMQQLSSGNTVSINIAQLNPGLYLLKYTDGQTIKSIKFMKE